MKKLFLFLASALMAGMVFAEGSESMANIKKQTYEYDDKTTYTGDNGQQWVAVGAMDAKVGGYNALAVHSSVSGNGLSGNLTAQQTQDGVGIVSFFVKGVGPAATGYGERTFRITAGSKSIDQKINVPSMNASYQVECKIDVTGASTLAVTSLQQVANEQAAFYIYNLTWTSFNGKTDTPTFSTDAQYIANGTDTVYYSGDNITVSLASTSDGATFYYTTNGSNPTTSSTKGDKIALAVGKTYTVKAVAYTSALGLSEVATKTYKVQKGLVVINDCSTNKWEGSYSHDKSTAFASLSGAPTYSLTGKTTYTYSDGVIHPWGLSLYAKNTNKQTLTVSYQTGGYVNSTWQADGDWTDITTISDFDSYGAKRFEVLLPESIKNSTVRFRFLSSGSGVRIDDICLISEMINQTTAPTISPASGEVKKGTNVTITPASGTTLHYIINGAAEQTSTKAVAVTVNEPTEIRAYATQNGYAQSVTVVATYTVEEVQPELAAPVISPNGGNLQWGTEVTITAGGQETIHYTIGSESEKTAVGSVKIKLTDNCTISAYSTRSGYKQSPTVNATFTVYKPVLADPVFSIQGGEVMYGTQVTISVENGASIVYTINGGKQQTATGSQTITITENMTISAQAVGEGYTDSKQVTAIFTVVYPQTEAPSFSLTDGEVERGTELKITGQKGDKIWYSLNESEWTFAITEATITINEDMEVKAYATRDNHTDSEIVSAIFIIKTPTDLEQSNLEQGLRNNEQGHVRKVFENGQILILLPDGRKVNTVGARVK
ncbi:MAG: chitobiase/beta-hexosaminidase C-terminal domain-containing protein [Paludibacteraceae bacterium]|nr:chitobiase/beta-hexosaminidase C-terminal domain-containing protein [Paludibacteraceae bacterium]